MCIHTYIYIYIYTYIHTYMCMNTYIKLCINTDIYTYVCADMLGVIHLAAESDRPFTNVYLISGVTKKQDC